MIQSNIDIAKEQLSYASALFFNKADIGVVATLTYSAYGIIIDLLKGTGCFRDWMQEDHLEIKSKDLWELWNRDWGFLKHAKDGIKEKCLDKDLIKNILFTAIHDFMILPTKLNNPKFPKASIEMEVYQLWFCSINERVFSKDHEIVIVAKELFSNIADLDNEEQIDLGRKILSREENRVTGRVIIH
jgi:hypothetical protein